MPTPQLRIIMDIQSTVWRYPGIRISQVMGIVGCYYDQVAYCINSGKINIQEVRGVAHLFMPLRPPKEAEDDD